MIMHNLDIASVLGVDGHYALLKLPLYQQKEFLEIYNSIGISKL